MNNLQITELFPEFDTLQAIHGSKDYQAIYGAGQIETPKICLIFMNPTARNVAANNNWDGIRAPWLGLKSTWKLLYKLNLLDDENLLKNILDLKPEEWTSEFSEKLYQHVANQSVYITNIAKCTQDDARHLHDSVFKSYLPTLIKELETIKPEFVITFGNQVSSIVLSKKISVSKYQNLDSEELITKSNNVFKIYPTYYPVGQGTRNTPKAIERISKILNKLPRTNLPTSRQESDGSFLVKVETLF